MAMIDEVMNGVYGCILDLHSKFRRLLPFMAGLLVDRLSMFSAFARIC